MKRAPDAEPLEGRTESRPPPVERRTFATRELARSLGAVGLYDAQAAAYAADGYARFTGRPAVVVARGYAESLEVMSGLATAWSDKLPVVAVNLVAPAEAERLRRGYSAVTRGSFTAEGADLEPHRAGLAAALARGPAQLLASGAALPELLRALDAIQPSPPVARGGGDGVFERLLGFRRPALVLGRGAALSGSPEPIAALAREWGAPVLLTAGATTTPPSRLVLWRKALEGHPVIPSGSLLWPLALTAADGILGLGTGLSEVDWFGLKDLRLHRGRVVRVALEAAEVEVAEDFVAAEAGRFAEQLMERARARGVRPAASWVARWTRGGESWQERIWREAESYSSAPHIEPVLLAHELARSAPPETIFIGEGGASGMWMWSYLWPRPYVFPVQHGTLGVPLPMAAGVLAASPGARVWCVIGDGAFLYHARELATLQESGADVAVFVFNDSSWNAIRLAQTFMFANRYVGTDLPASDYAAVARAQGCGGLSARTPAELRAAIERVKTTRGPVVVDVHVPKDRVPFAGASFVLAELDGALRSLALPSLVSSLVSAVKGRVPARTLKVAVEGLWGARR